MNDLISRSTILEKAWDVLYDGKYVQVVDVGDILEVPTIKPEDLRPKGRRIWKQFNESDGHTYAECSNCHNVRIVDIFCSNCGAKMTK